jgi:hypothetical protein
LKGGFIGTVTAESEYLQEGCEVNISTVARVADDDEDLFSLRL